MNKEKKFLTVGQLRDRLSEIIAERPRMADAQFFVDVEARKFNVHMIELENVWVESDEGLAIMGLGDFVYANPDFSLAE